MIKGDLYLPGKKISLVSSHLGWTDKYEVFENQFDRMLSHLDKDHLLLIAGDFNVSPTTIEYETLLNKGLFDLYGSKPKHLLEPTHLKNIDLHKGASRIDYIFSNSNLEVLNRDILFKEDRVSDHFGVYMKIEI
jgi:endonuclease/exonuclease/phosphatase family metal-dependent hydrolase